MLNRRRFVAALSAAGVPVGAARADAEKKLLLPTDVPNEFGFRIMWYNPVPPIDQRTWRLRVGGLVENPSELSVGDLRALPQVTQSSRMKCVQCWSSRATWGGFRFRELLKVVRPKLAATAIRLDCADKWYEYMSLEEMASPTVLMCLDLEGKPLPDEHGAPLRMLDPSKYGYKSAKLVTSITFVEKGAGSMACDLGPYYSADGKILPGYDHPLDLGEGVRKKITGGEITDY